MSRPWSNKETEIFLKIAADNTKTTRTIHDQYNSLAVAHGLKKRKFWECQYRLRRLRRIGKLRRIPT